jgi:hypothetical protein
MHPSTSYLVAGLAWLALLVAADRLAGARRRTAFRCVAGVLTFTAGLAALQRVVFGGNVALDVARGAIAATALACVLYERHRARAGRPVRERRKRAVGLALGAAAAAAYFAGAAFSYRAGFHVWDQYHYFVGSRYFRELGYDGLYRCSAVAMDDLGRVITPGALTGLPTTIDLRAEVRAPGRLIRNLGVDNELVPVAPALADAAACRGRFSGERWAAFKADVRFFRLAAGPDDWARMQRDHGYNPPPGWTLAGGLIANLRPAGPVWQVVLGLLDVALLLGMLGAVWWAFGWRAAAVAAVFWGTQAFSPFYWTGGGFLRQDWLFWTVLAACLGRKRRYGLSGAALAYAALLRIFPVLFALGWAVSALGHLRRTGRLAPAHRRILLGAATAAAFIVPAGAAVAGTGAWAAFYHHTIQVHGSTPLTNNMGLPVVLAHGVGSGPDSGRLRYVRDERLPDPLAPWKEGFAERLERARPVLWGVVALMLAWFVRVARRVRRPWIALGLGQVWPVVLLPLTCYYYSFLVLAAPLTRARRGLEAPLLGLAAASQVVWWAFWWNDDRYAALSVLALAFCCVVLAAFSPGRRRARERVRQERPQAGAAPVMAPG